MKERPILFSGPLIRAILEGKKTVTRRLINPPPPGEPRFFEQHQDWFVDGMSWCRRCPYGVTGDALWARETWALTKGNGHRVVYRADMGTDRWPSAVEWNKESKWTPSIYMRRHHSRITLGPITVRAERLQAITAEDIIAEGVVERGVDNLWVSAFDGKTYEQLSTLWEAAWDSINGKRAPAASSPWVWVIRWADFEVRQ